jgi:hypothetical protein
MKLSNFKSAVKWVDGMIYKMTGYEGCALERVIFPLPVNLSFID